MRQKFLVAATFASFATVAYETKADEQKIVNLSVNHGVMSFSYPKNIDILKTSPASSRLLNSSDFNFSSSSTTQFVGSLNFRKLSILYDRIAPTDFSTSLSFAAPDGHRLPSETVVDVATGRGSDMKAILTAKVKSEKLLLKFQPTDVIKFNFGLARFNFSDALSLESTNLVGLPNTTLHYDYTAKNDLSGPIVGFDARIPLGKSKSSINLSANIQKLKGTAKTTAKVESPNLSVQNSESFETFASTVSADYVYKLNENFHLSAGVSLITIEKLAYSADQISGHDLRNRVPIKTAYTDYFSHIYKFGFKINF